VKSEHGAIVAPWAGWVLAWSPPPSGFLAIRAVATQQASGLTLAELTFVLPLLDTFTVAGADTQDGLRPRLVARTVVLPLNGSADRFLVVGDAPQLVWRRWNG